MDAKEFEKLLDLAKEQLTLEARENVFQTSKSFEERVRRLLKDLAAVLGVQIDAHSHPFAFPDISIGEFGVEVKYTANDTWRSVANSVFETYRSPEVKTVYVVFGKMGGTPEVRWDKYEDCVIHVRTSHVPRFELEIGAESSLFELIGVQYDEFRHLTLHEKMMHIRRYAKGRMKTGERLWWIDDHEEPQHTLPIQVRLYTSLTMSEKRRVRAEAVLLCPQILRGGRVRNKYDDVAMFLLTYHGIIASQTRDLFSAGSVAHVVDKHRGGIYIQRSIEALQPEMLLAASEMDDALFVEYWGRSVPPEQRIKEWLLLADEFAEGWKPSNVLFVSRLIPK